MFTQKYIDVPLDTPLDPAWVLQAHPELQSLYGYWASHRQGRPLPLLAAVDFAELGGAFPGVLLAQSAPAAAGESGQDGGWQHIFHEIDDRGLGAPAAAYRHRHIPRDACAAVRRAPAPLLARADMLTGDGALLDFDCLFLPLAVDGAARIESDLAGILVFAAERSPTGFAL